MIRINSFPASLAILLLVATACSPASSVETPARATTSTTMLETAPNPTNPEPNSPEPTSPDPTSPDSANPTTQNSTVRPADGTGAWDVSRDVDFTAGLSLDVFSPRSPGPWPVVVFFHGGSWYGGAKQNVEPFAAALAEAGFVVFNATYRTGQFGGGYPQSYQDIGCAIGLANLTAADYGGDAERVFVAGHSAGAHLASTVLFGEDGFSDGDCTRPGPIQAEGFIGLAGPYDVTGFAPLLAPWFGGAIAEIPDIFAAGSPSAYLDTALTPVLLIHGTIDELVPIAQTTDFAETLEAFGWDVEVALVEEATHGGVIDPLLAADQSIEAISDFVER